MKQMTANAGEAVRKEGLLLTIDMSVNWYSHNRNQCGDPPKAKNRAST